jgi:hypothetical protein
MIYAKVNAEFVIKYPYVNEDLQAENPFTNFDFTNPINELYNNTEDALSTGNQVVVVTIDSTINFDPLKKVVQDKIPSFDGKHWVIASHIVDKTQQEIDDHTPVVGQQVIDKITANLEASAWTQAPNSGLPPAAIESWRVYREQLSDIVKQDGFPLAITWPVTP